MYTVIAIIVAILFIVVALKDAKNSNVPVVGMFDYVALTAGAVGVGLGWPLTFIAIAIFAVVKKVRR